jgi:hypothetical protein
VITKPLCQRPIDRKEILVRPLAKQKYNPDCPLQTKLGAAEALRCGHNRVDELLRRGLLKTTTIDRRVRITTESILAIANGEVDAAGKAA